VRMGELSHEMAALKAVEKEIRKMNQKGVILHPANESSFKLGYIKKCKKCGYEVKTWPKFKRLRVLKPYRGRFGDFYPEEIYPCPKCKDYDCWQNIPKKCRN
jgi:hypothetical protein